ncbi:MAG: hypothetical protein IJS94_05755, partial [Clostridia bacterium]|nr:hypothetical protein [Clostridia bacterium]
HPKTVPDAALLKISLEPRFAGLKLDYLCYEESEDGKKHFSTVLQKVNNAEGRKVYEVTYLQVDDSGVVEIPYYGNEHFVLTRKLESRYLLSVTTEKAYDDASISKGNVIIMDGNTTGYRDIFWYKAGTDQLFLDIRADSDHVINKILYNGTPIEEVEEDYFAVKRNNQYLDEIGDYSGKGKVFLEIKDTTRDYALTVSFKHGTNTDYTEYPGIEEEEESKLPLIIAISIILVAMVCGCVVFIYKWRQDRDID